MNTYIFSNCAKSTTSEYTKNLLENVPLDSKLILLNRGNIYWKISAFYKYPNQSFILRKGYTHGLAGYFGLVDLVGSQRPVQDIILIDGGPAEKMKIKIGRNDNTVEDKTINTPWFNEYVEKTGGSLPTTGFCAYYLVQDLYNVNPDEIILVNFYGNEDSSTGKVKIHNWDYEDEWLKDKNRIFI